MPDQSGYFGGNGGYQRQPSNGGNFSANNQTQAMQAAQSAQAMQTYPRQAGAFPYSRSESRSDGFVNGSAVYGNAMNGNGVGQPAPNMNFPTNSGIRQFQQGQSFSGNMPMYNNNGGNNGNISPEAMGRENLRNSPPRTEFPNVGSRRARRGGNYRNNFGNRNSPFTNNFPQPPTEPANIPEPPLTHSEEKAEEADSKKSSLLSLLDGVKVDPEKTTLILLIVILARNGADITLIMALAYLLM